MKISKRTLGLLYSTFGVVIAGLLVICVNLLASYGNMKIDLTEESLYTLSDQTLEILDDLDQEVTIHFFYSRDAQMKMELKSYAERVEDLLDEYAVKSSKLKVLKYSPALGNDASERAEFWGMTGKVVGDGNRYYLGMVINSLSKTEYIPSLIIEKENLLEYEVSRAITKVIRQEETSIGVISPIPVAGKVLGRNHQPLKAWSLIKNLKFSFKVKSLPYKCERIDQSLKVVLVLHPSKLPAKTMFALDQYLMQGGKLIVAVDPYSAIADHYQKVLKPEDNKYLVAQSELGKLFDAWGVTWNPSKTVTDMIYGRRSKNDTGGDELLPSDLNLTSDARNSTHTVTGSLTKLRLVHSGVIGLDHLNEKITAEVLLHSSLESDIADAGLAAKALLGQQTMFGAFKSTNKEKPLAVLLRGQFKTAFRAGPPAGIESDVYGMSNGQDSAVAIISDFDMLADPVCIQYQREGGKVVEKGIANDNMNFFINLAEYMAGGKGLIGIRCRQTLVRPFKQFNEIRANADVEFKNQIMAQQRVIKGISERYEEVSGAGSSHAGLNVSDKLTELKQQHEAAVRDMTKTNEKLKRERHKGVKAVQSRVLWLCILLIPGLVALLGVGLAIFKMKRSSAR